MLFELAGCQATPDFIKMRLAERSVGPRRIEAVLPMLRVSFHAAETEAKRRAAEARGAWKAITGEVYGDKKATTWKVEQTDSVSLNVLVEEAALTNVSAEIDQINQQLGAIKGRQEAFEVRQKQKAALEEQADKIERIQQKRAHDVAELAEWENKLAEARAKASGSQLPCPDLMHTLAMLVEGSKGWNSTALFEEAKRAMMAYDHAYRPREANSEWLSVVAKYEKAHALLDRAVGNCERDLANAEAAQTQLKAWVHEGEESKDASEEIALLQSRLEVLRTTRQHQLEAVAFARNQIQDVADAERRTTEAAGHHADVQAWTLIAESMAPDGIPGELLAKALRPINDQLLAYSQLAGWQHVQINHDLTILANNRPYSLLSESEQWRVDCLIALTIAKLSGLKLVMLDRFDVLDINGRRELVVLLDVLVYLGELETAVICGTLKQAPTPLDTMQVYWLENGEVTEVMQPAEAAA